MEELKLHQITLLTSDPAGLERFLSDVMGGEIESIGPDEFIADVANMRLHVRSGNSSQQEWVFEIPASGAADLKARWEFFCFRHPQVSHSNEAMFSDANGLTVRIAIERVKIVNENQIISVRNY